ncbi:putative ribonuclease H-like domain-containing protein [Tanacetum coccineum]|uniref:Ribonuclease H-like domain-containing protein n=1 Tax=Tanacetum coccineum TaxID=301880 RepID=A0ABQ4ZGF9_9ASTR
MYRRTSMLQARVTRLYFKPVFRKLVWWNKSDLDTISIDDLYNNFKIVEQEVKRTVTSSSNSNSSSQNMAFVSSPNSTNEVNTVNVQVSTANSPVSTADTPDSSANLSDATVYAFLANQPNGSQLVHEDLEQIHEDDLEEMDLKWQLVLLNMKARRGPKNQDNRNRNQDSSRRTVNVEETSSKAMVAIDGAGFDWSFMADEEVPTNMAIMAFSDSEKNEVMFCDQIAVLKGDTSFKDSEINALKSEIEKLKKEKESNQIKIDKFENASKSLDKLIGSQISDDYIKDVRFVRIMQISQENGQNDSNHDIRNGYSAQEQEAYEKQHVLSRLDSRNVMDDIVTFWGRSRGGRIIVKETLKTLMKVRFYLKFLEKNMYSVDMKNIVPRESLTCLVAKATLNESMLWHRRLDWIDIWILKMYVNKLEYSNDFYSYKEILQKDWKKSQDRMKKPVGFDKKKLECFNCHNTGHFTRECTVKGTNDEKKKRDSVYQNQDAGKQEKNQMGLLTMDDGIVNWGEHSVEEERNYALMAISSSNKVSLCSKTCTDSYAKLKTLCNEQMNQLCDQEVQLLAYSQAVKTLEAQIKRTITENIDTGKDSSKNLCKLIDSGMSSNSKIGLGYGIQSNNEVLSYEEEMNFSIFNCSKEHSVGKPLYSRFKTSDFKGVPHPLSGDYTPKPQEEIDDSLYVYGKRGPQKPETSVLDDKSNEYSTCQSNDSEGSLRTSTEHSVDLEPEILTVPKVMSESTPKEKELECKDGKRTKKMAKEAELKKQRVLNTSNGVAKPIWNSVTRINHANHFVSRPVPLNPARTNVNSVKQKVNSGWSKVNTSSVNINTARTSQPKTTNSTPSFNSARPLVNKLKQNNHFSKSHSPVKRPIVKNTARMTYSYAVKENWGTAVKTSACYNWRRKRPTFNHNSGPTLIRNDHPLKNMENRGIFDSGCSGHMTGNKDHLEDFEEFKGGSVTFGGSKGYITGKGRIKVGNLDFDSVSFVKELGHFNLFSISQICDKQYKVLFTETECLVVSPDFKMPDENQILLKVPRQHNMYSFDMKTPTLSKDYACLIGKAASDESKLWHKRLGHIKFKILNKLVKGNLVRGLPSKTFRNDHTCVACQKGKQHKASCKAKLERTITEPLHTLHMDLFGPTSVKSINHASYCLVITDDCTRFSWVFFLGSKDETSGILQHFIRQIENQLNHRVKIIRSDNGTEFKNRDMLEFCRDKGIKQEYSNEFEGKCVGFLVGYSLNSKAYRVYHLVTKKVEFNLHVNFLEEKPNIKGVGNDRMDFDIDDLTDSMNYVHVSLDNQANPYAGMLEVTNSTGMSEVTNSAGISQAPNANVSEEEDEVAELIVIPTTVKHVAAKVETRKFSIKSKEKELHTTSKEDHVPLVPYHNTTSTPSVNTGSTSVNTGKLDATQHDDPDDSEMLELEIYHRPKQGIFDRSSYDEEGVVDDFNNLPLEVAVSPIPTLRIHNIHPQSQILEPKKIFKALQDDSWVEAMQEELLQFKLQQVWILVDLPHGAKVIGTKWVFRNKKDERGVVVRNKARLVAQGYKQEQGVDYDEVFAPVARIEAIQLFLAFASFMGIIVYQMDVKSAFLYGTIDEEVFQMSSMGEHSFFLGLQVKQKIDGIFISQDKYVAEMLTKFDLASVKTAITPMETKVALTKDKEAADVDVTPKTSHLHDVKRIFKYLKGKPNLGLWYPRESSFDLEAYTDSDYAGASFDRKSTTGGCQFLERRLISWQCKKQTIVATSTTEAEYVAAASCPTPIPAPEPTPIPAPEPTPIPESTPTPEYEPMEHIFEQQQPTQTHEPAAQTPIVEDLLQLVPALNPQRLMGRNLQKDMSKGYETPKQGTTSGNLDISPQGLEAAETLAETLSQIKNKRRNDRTKVKRRLDAEDISVGFDDINTASEVPLVSTEANISTASRTVTYSRRSAEKNIIKDKGKAIMTEPEPEKKSKRQLEEERLSFAEAMRLQEQMDDEQRAQIARDRR